MKKSLDKILKIFLAIGIILLNTGLINIFGMQATINAATKNIYTAPNQNNIIETWSISSNSYLKNIYTKVENGRLYVNVDITKNVVKYGASVTLPNGLEIKKFKTDKNDNLLSVDLTSYGYTAESLYGLPMTIKTLYPQTSGGTQIFSSGTINIRSGAYYQSNYVAYGQAIYDLFADDKFNSLASGTTVNQINDALSKAPLYPSAEKARLQNLLNLATGYYYNSIPPSSGVCPTPGNTSGVAGNTLSNTSYTKPNIAQPDGTIEYFDSLSSSNPYGGNFRTYIVGNDVYMELNAYGTWKGYFYAVVLPNGNELKVMSETAFGIDYKVSFNLANYGYTSENINTQFVNNQITTKNYNTNGTPHVAGNQYVTLTNPYYLDDYTTFGKSVYKLFYDNNLSKIAVNLTQADIDRVNASVKPAGTTSEKTRLLGLITKVQGYYDAYYINMSAACDSVNGKLLNASKTDVLENVTQTTITDALTAISKVPPGDIKTTLMNDQKLAQKYYDARVNASNKTKALLNAAKDDLNVGVTEAMVTEAQNAVDNLPDSVFKEELQKDIDKANKLFAQREEAINVVANLLTPTKDDIKVGVNQASIDNATLIVSKLPNNDLKTALMADIAKAQAILDSRKDILALVAGLLNEAKNDVLPGVNQTTIDNVNKEIALVVEGEFKQGLVNEVSIAQDIINGKKVVSDLFTTAGKTTLKSTVVIANIDAAQLVVDLVPAGDLKDALNQDLENARTLLNNDISAKDMVLDLFTDASKTDIKTSTTQTKIDEIRIDVNKLGDGQLKDNLKADLVLAEKILDAKSKTEALFTDSTKTLISDSTTTKLIDDAEKAIDLLTDSPLKTELTANIATAREQLAKREESKALVLDLFTDATKTDIKKTTDQAKIDSAKTSVDKLSESDIKTNLLADIALAQQILNAKNNVAAIFTDNKKDAVVAGTTLDSIKVIEDQVALLPDGDAKTTLQADLETAKNIVKAAIKQLEDATNSVNDLFTDTNKNDIKETTDQGAIDNSTELVNALPESGTKDNLLIDLGVAQAILDANNAVDNLFTDNTHTNTKPGTSIDEIVVIEEIVATLPDGPAKDKLTEELENAKEIVQEKIDNANNAATVIEDLFTDATKTDIKVSTTQTLIDEIRNSLEIIEDASLKAGFEADLVLAENILNAKNMTQALFTDTTKVDVLADIKLETIENAETAVNKLVESQLKTNLLVDIQKAKDLLTQRNDALSIVAGLFTDESKTDTNTLLIQNRIDNATTLVNALPNNELKTSLLADIALAQQIVNAKNNVAAIFTDNKKDAVVAGTTLDSIKVIEDQVALLPDGNAKTTLQADLETAKNIVKAAIKQLEDATNSVNDLFTDTNKNDIKETTDQGAIDNSTELVNALPESGAKDNLLIDLGVAQAILDANNAVDNLFTDNTHTNTKPGTTIDEIVVIEEIVATLPDGPAKDKLTEELENAKEIVQEKIDNANNAATVIADLFTDATKTDIKVSTTQTLIDEIRNSLELIEDASLKAGFEADLVLAETILDAKTKTQALFTDATKTVIKDATTSAMIDDAEEAINMLVDSALKTELLNNIATARDQLTKKEEGKTLVLDLFTDATKTDIKKSTDQVKIDAATTLVNALPNADYKTNLLADIALAQQILNAKNNVAAIFTDNKKDAVVAGTTLDSIKVIEDQVALLPDGDAKTTLQADLETAKNIVKAAIKQLEDATNSVNDLFTDANKNDIKETTDQGAIDNSTELVNALPESGAKYNLLIDLGVAQAILDANNAVDNLFTDNTHTNTKPGTTIDEIVVIEEIVATLPDGPAKDKLTEELENAKEIVQEKIDNANNAATVIADLFTDATKTDIKVSTTQTLIDEIRNSLELIEDASLKAGFEADLVLAENILNAKNMTQALFTDTTKVDVLADIKLETIENAETAVNKLVESQLKTNLLADIQKAKDLLTQRNDALSIVAGLFTDESKTDTNTLLIQNRIDNATTLVNALPNNELKTSLLADIALAQQIVNAKNNVAAIFTDNKKDAVVAGTTLDSIKVIEDQVALLPDGNAKTTLQADLETAKNIVKAAIKQLEDATNSVNDLFTDTNKNDIKETTDQGAIDNSTELVNALPESGAKDNLLIDLGVAQAILDANNAVDNLFTDNTHTNTKPGTTIDEIVVIEEIVATLPDGPAKDKLTEELENAKEIVQGKIDNETSATNSVADLFTDATKTDIKKTTDQAKIDASTTLVNALPNNELKTSLLADIALAQQILNAKNNVAAIFTDNKKDAVVAGTTLDSIKVIEDQVALLPDGDAKTTLQADLETAKNIVKAAIKLLEDATNSVNDLFTDANKNDIKETTDQGAIDNSTELVNALPESGAKDNLLIDLGVAQAILDANNAVDNLFTDNTHTNTKPGTTIDEIVVIEEIVATLPDGPAKDKLTEELENAKEIVQEKIDNANNAATVIADLFTDATKTDIKVSTTQTLIDEIRNSLELIEDASLKAGFEADLVLAENILNAKNMTQALFTDTTKVDVLADIKLETIENAETAVNKLVESQLKTNLLVDIQKAKDLLTQRNDALSIVAGLFTDESKTDTNTLLIQNRIDNATTLVNALPNNELKTSLLADIALAQQIVNAKNNVAAIFTDNKKDAVVAGTTLDSIKVIEDQVALLPDGDAKTTLQADLETAKNIVKAAIKQLEDATNSVNDLFTDTNKNDIKETTDQGAIDNSTELVNALPESGAKDNLLIDLGVAQAILDANNAVDNLFTDNTHTNTKPGTTIDEIIVIEEIVATLPDGPAKDKLTEELENAKEIVQEKIDNANNAATVIADLFTDATKTDIKVTTTQTLIDEIRNSLELIEDASLKAGFEADLVLAETILDAKTKTQALFTDATKTVIKDATTSAMIDDAEEAINMLVDSALKTELLNNIATARDQLTKKEEGKTLVLDLFTDATKTDIKKSTDQVKIDAATTLVNALPNADYKTNLLADIALAQQILNAKNNVAAIFTDNKKDAVVAGTTLDSIKVIEDQVALLPDGDAKTTLQADLETAKNIVKAAIKQLEDATNSVNDLFTDTNKNDIKETTDQGAIDNSTELVNALPESGAKDNLLIDLGVAQAILDNKNSTSLKLVDNFKDEDGIIVIYRTGKTNETKNFSSKYNINIEFKGKVLSAEELKNVTYTVKAIGGFEKSKTYVEIADGSNQIIAKKSGVVEITGTYNGFSSTIKVVVPGDVSRDGRLSGIDSMRIQNYILDKDKNLSKLGYVDEFTEKLADLSSDNKVNGIDKGIIQNMINKFITPTN